MSANNNQEKKDKQITLTGKVETKTFGERSKSEHQSVYLHSNKGDFKLRRVGGNPFSDPSLDKYIGKTIKAIGTLSGYTFHVKDIEIIESA